MLGQDLVGMGGQPGMAEFSMLFFGQHFDEGIDSEDPPSGVWKHVQDCASYSMDDLHLVVVVNGLVQGKIYRSIKPQISWENRWFPVKIFP